MKDGFSSSFDNLGQITETAVMLDVNDVTNDIAELFTNNGESNETQKPNSAVEDQTANSTFVIAKILKKTSLRAVAVSGSCKEQVLRPLPNLTSSPTRALAQNKSTNSNEHAINSPLKRLVSSKSSEEHPMTKSTKTTSKAPLVSSER